MVDLLLGCVSRLRVVACLVLACSQQVLTEGASYSSARQAMGPARNGDETLTANCNAAREERGYHNSVMV